MQCSATFHFFHSLNDFFSKSQKNTVVVYRFNPGTSVKDAIEAIGIPHVEVDSILVNNLPENFNYILTDSDNVEVFPYSANASIKPHPTKFIVDVHLGKLARLLRLTGFNTLYANNYTDKEIVTKAVDDNRIALTRDVGLLKHKAITYGYWLRSQIAEEQLAEIISRFNLLAEIKTFTRCLVCNGEIVPVSKESIIEKLPANTKEQFNEFYQCEQCKRVYWKGSHYEKMEKFIEQIFLKLG